MCPRNLDSGGIKPTAIPPRHRNWDTHHRNWDTHRRNWDTHPSNDRDTH